MLGAGTLSGSGYAVSVSGVTTLHVIAANASDCASFADNSGGSTYTGGTTFSQLTRGAQADGGLWLPVRPGDLHRGPGHGLPVPRDRPVPGRHPDVQPGARLDQPHPRQ